MSGAEESVGRVLPGIYEILPPTGGVPDGTQGLTAIQKLWFELGLNTNFKRSVFAAATTSAVVWALQPAASFSSGVARNFDDGGVPWWVWPAGAVVAIYFIS